MDITIDSTIQHINFNYGGVDYPVKILKYMSTETGGVAEKIWEEASPSIN